MLYLFHKKKIFIIGPVCIKRRGGEALRASLKRHWNLVLLTLGVLQVFSCPQSSGVIFYWTLFWNGNSNTAKQNRLSREFNSVATG